MRVHQIVPVFHVSDLDVSLAFYRDILGFTEDFRVGGYVGLKLDDFGLNVSQSDGVGRPIGGGTLYIFCDEVDDYFAARVAGRDVNLLQPPKDQPYGMRDFIVKDPDGNQLSFGQDLGD